MKKRILTRPPKKSTAYHEAGHAVAAMVHDLPFSLVSVVLRRGACGKRASDGRLSCGWLFTESIARGLPARLRQTIARKAVITAYAGVEAERAFDSQGKSRCRPCVASVVDDVFMFREGDDYDLAHKAAMATGRYSGAGVDNKRLRAYLNRRRIDARQLVKKHWRQVEAIAGALIERKTLTEPEVRRIAEHSEKYEGRE